MSGSGPPPPAYEEIEKTSLTQKSNPNWQAWYRKLIALTFNQDEAVKYTQLLVNNDVEISMIPELTDSMLKTIGIEKAGHRIRVLRLQNKSPTQTPARPQPTASAQPVMNTPRCTWHPHIAANEKCRKCGRLLCLHCRRESIDDHCVRYYCKDCHAECVIL